MSRDESGGAREGHGFRRPVGVARVGEAGLKQSVTAQAGELARIAAYVGVETVRSLKAEVSLAHWRGRGLSVHGKMEAEVTQACVVTLEPVDAHIECEFERRFLPADMLSRDQDDQRDVVVDPESDEHAEPLGREVDLGEILVEELALNLEPYPRKPGAAFTPDDSPQPSDSPFATLAKLKPRLVRKGG